MELNGLVVEVIFLLCCTVGVSGYMTLGLLGKPTFHALKRPETRRLVGIYHSAFIALLCYKMQLLLDSPFLFMPMFRSICLGMQFFLVNLFKGYSHAN